MSDDFFRSRMGHTFYEGTMPNIAKALEDLVREQKEANKLKKIEMIERMGLDRFNEVCEQIELALH